ncbi:acyl-CoA thioesterase [Agaribacterium haliotis]|uniref:acyl-CoA thioesterase n=1 Tax=Agaribacterium haliotis TaxID=2013869 RepID=UPI000BB5579C|nr:acyl-CoA thioesterase domain-containing protein [Agaribacterium haliotis]
MNSQSSKTKTNTKQCPDAELQVAPSMLDILKLEARSASSFQSCVQRENFRSHLFGGQVIAQALRAACHTVDSDRCAHSLHAYFLRAGTAAKPVDYEVENLRDGKSISSRRILAKQDKHVLFSMSASFHKHEQGFSHQQDIDLSDCPSPEQLLQQKQKEQEKHGAKPAQSTVNTMPFEFVSASGDLFLSEQVQAPEARFWLRSALPEHTSSIEQACALAYVSDLGLLATAVLPHPSNLFSDKLAPASIDHALWLHNVDFDLNDWLLCCSTSPWAANARGFTTARFYDRRGVLVASAAQEGLLRFNSYTEEK